MPSKLTAAPDTTGPGLTVYTASLLADMETPLGAYWKLAWDQERSFLLESVTGGEQVARYSILGVRPQALVRCVGSRLIYDGADARWERELEPGEDPLTAIHAMAPQVAPGARAGLPSFVGGAVGMIAYDYVRRVENLPATAVDDLGVDELAFFLCHDVVVFDHARNLIQIVLLDQPSTEGESAAEERCQWIADRLSGPPPELPPAPAMTAPAELPPFRANRTREDYEAAVRRCIDYIKAGDAFQIVPSLRLEIETQAHPLTLYRSLRSLNPSPYMMLLRMGAFDIVGASPELLVGLEGRRADVRPIAGTRARGADHAEDLALEAELLADEKERAEHAMLVDLGRNDLGRVCEYGSVEVEELMRIERYSHVMHIVSDVSGRLRDGLGPVDLIRASFPAGTLSGAPKVRAMEIIEENEPTRRGLYGGAVGFLSANGDVDLAIAIRTMLVKGGTAYVQAGAGVVYDSNPAKEYQECLNKASAVVRAIQMAGGS
jgi:anthranilate synthase component 1